MGIHSDDDVSERRGPHQPIMSLHERSLSVLSCKYVDEVIIGATEAKTMPNSQGVTSMCRSASMREVSMQTLQDSVLLSMFNCYRM